MTREPEGPRLARSGLTRTAPGAGLFGVALYSGARRFKEPGVH